MEITQENLRVLRKFIADGEYAGQLSELARRANLNPKTVRRVIDKKTATLNTLKKLNTAAAEFISEYERATSSLKQPVA